MKRQKIMAKTTKRREAPTDSPFGRVAGSGTDRKTFTAQMQRYVANIAITGSTLRNQGAKGVVETAREFLAQLNLDILRKTEPRGYAKQLDKWTGALRETLPGDAQNWGTARKAINVFMVQAFLNRYLAQEYDLVRFGQVMETPLDSQAATKLRKRAGRGRLPTWHSIKDLTPEASQRYQDFAADLAARRQLPRACLDIMLWRTEE